ncbi:single-stranded-DNA-specific exonuclease RecJ [Paenibacillus sp. CGMCC 1.16610]|uniref:Single-stranded-DNA-specific exonuclease RecJ n=1 Tax=Paenibacillus anseongense TaxID=2682845 RepID=A0ABW9U709_9BACL|nr:single-stranded-DNA-specific exonuclease RecJ [Paenibacillus sp. CGMCC 1.16610]MBA2939262.1 single-stranded-DNA-specific exonuclease RecJ [Paenibacillus sp. CGMCC 1.16610]MVQ35221.1 single-stranded-DNA-specific exonuclease RecJ [Paenibacillus anseongense]
MLAPKARWSIGHADEMLIETFVRELQIDPLVARLLVLRDIRTIPEAEQFMHGGVQYYHDPYLLDGMLPAVERIRKALQNNEFIRIYGDYDADGVSSTSLMHHLLTGLGARFDTYIPHRIREGYGLNRSAIDLAKEQGVDLLITVDTGISAVQEIAYCEELGIDVIVTDHHEPPEHLPQALSVINPKKPGCPYPFKHLAGVGVALKLAHALLDRLPEELLEFAALGTVADLMPLNGENRLIVKQGLQRMQDSAYAGFRSLIGVSGIERKEVTAGHIGFSLAPRINASGRLEAADIAVKLLTTSNETEAEQIAFELDMLNKERQLIVEEMVKEAFVLAEEQQAKGLDKVIVVAKEGWNVGVVGIVASKIVDKFYRPTLVLSIDPQTGIAKGSARSIAGFDLHKALTVCEEWLDHYGGHQAAAGMSLSRGHLEAFTQKLNELAAATLTEQDYIPLLKADAVCSLPDVPIASIEGLEKLAPFGMGNPAPRFMFTDLSLDDIRTMGKEKQHLKLALSQAKDEVSCSVEAVGFGKGSLAGLITQAAKVDVLGELSINEWNGVRKPQIVMQDLKITHMQLFDWRGAGQLSAKLNMLQNNLATSNTKNQVPGIVLFDETDVKAFAATAFQIGDEIPYWVVQDSGLLRPGNQTASQLDFAHMKDIILYTIPRSLVSLQGVLQQALGMMRCYPVFAELGPDSGSTLPSREMFKMMYGTLQKEGSLNVQDPRLMASFSKRSGLSPAMIQFILSVFEELSFIERQGAFVKLHASPAKKDLTASRIYQHRMNRQEVESVVMYSSAKELEQWIAQHIKQENHILEEII